MPESRETLIKEAEEKNKKLAIAAAVAMHGQRAEDIIILDLRRLIDYADFFVIASASSMSRMRGVAKAAEKAMVKAKSRKLNHPDRETGWSLLDYGDVIIHVFDNEARDYYRIEDLWGDAPRVEWEDHIQVKVNN
jgi:iojap-like ribosome-associated protein